MTRDDTPTELFTIPETARLLRVPEGWLRKKVTARLVPHCRLGKHVRFTHQQVRAILDAGAVALEPVPHQNAQGLARRSRR